MFVFFYFCVCVSYFRELITNSTTFQKLCHQTSLNRPLDSVSCCGIRNFNATVHIPRAFPLMLEFIWSTRKKDGPFKRVSQRGMPPRKRTPPRQTVEDKDCSKYGNGPFWHFKGATPAVFGYVGWWVASKFVGGFFLSRIPCVLLTLVEEQKMIPKIGESSW